MTNETTHTAATVAAQGAHVAPERASAGKGASPTKGAPQGQKGAQGGKATTARKTAAKAKKAAHAAAKSAAPRATSKGAQILELIGRSQGASLAEIMKVTSWQAHYADVQIMPTCVGNPVCGTGIAAMESA